MVFEHDHKGHRERVKQRFLQENLDGFEAHQVLEMLLFYAIPQKDTNPLAHTLIKRFGSFAGVLDAPVEDLMQVPGIKENAAILIKLFPAVFRFYAQDKNKICECYNTLEKIGAFAKTLYIGVTVEKAFLLCFDNRMRLKDCYPLASGTVNSVPIEPSRVAEHALRIRASGVVLVHNHPDGLPLATREDIAITHEVEAACKTVGVYFLEHVIVAGDDFMPIMRYQKGYERPSPMSKIKGSDFYRNFYEGDAQKD